MLPSMPKYERLGLKTSFWLCLLQEGTGSHRPLGEKHFCREMPLNIWDGAE